MGDHRSDQGDIVDVLTVTRADLAFPLRVGEFLIGDRVLLDPVLRGQDHPNALRQAKPVALRVTKVGWNVGVDGLVVNRLGDTLAHRAGQPSNVDGEDQVGRAVSSFGLDPF